MDDADRVCRLPDDEWQDYDTTYASEIKQKREALLLSYSGFELILMFFF